MRKIPVLAGALAISTLLTAGGVSAFFTDRQSVSANLSVATGRKISLIEPNFNEEEAVEIAPLDVITKDPQIVNEGAEDIYVFCKVEVPSVVTKGVASPVFSYENNPAWGALSLEFSEDKQVGIYYYGGNKLDPLKPKATSEPVFNDVRFQNPAGDTALCGMENFIDVKMISVETSAVAEKTKDVTAKNIYELITSEIEKEDSMVDFVSKENRFEIGDFTVNFTSVFEDDAGKNILDKKISVENSGNLGAIVFLKLFPLYDSEENQIDITKNDSGLTKIGCDKNAHVFAVNRELKGNESIEDILGNVSANCHITNAVISSIQSDNLRDDAGEINTEGTIENDTLMRIYELTKDEETPYFKDEDGLESEGESPEGIEIMENFPTPNPLKAGENEFVKEVVIKNISAYPQNVKVNLSFSDKELEKIIYLSNDGGASYVGVSEYFNNPPAGWSYKSDGLDGYFYLNEPLQPGKKSPTLITNLKINFENEEAVRDFDVYVYAQSTRGDWDENNTEQI